MNKKEKKSNTKDVYGYIDDLCIPFNNEEDNIPILTPKGTVYITTIKERSDINERDHHRR